MFIALDCILESWSTSLEQAARGGCGVYCHLWCLSVAEGGGWCAFTADSLVMIQCMRCDSCDTLFGKMVCLSLWQNGVPLGLCLWCGSQRLLGRPGRGRHGPDLATGSPGGAHAVPEVAGAELAELVHVHRLDEGAGWAEDVLEHIGVGCRVRPRVRGRPAAHTREAHRDVRGRVGDEARETAAHGIGLLGMEVVARATYSDEGDLLPAELVGPACDLGGLDHSVVCAAEDEGVAGQGLHVRRLLEVLVELAVSAEGGHHGLHGRVAAALGELRLVHARRLEELLEVRVREVGHGRIRIAAESHVARGDERSRVARYDHVVGHEAAVGAQAVRDAVGREGAPGVANEDRGALHGAGANELGLEHGAELRSVRLDVRLVALRGARVAARGLHEEASGMRHVLAQGHVHVSVLLGRPSRHGEEDEGGQQWRVRVGD
mmetsp:Transcript_11109/g.32996  ORF Transcript_11109/g.32996 Transcript_11109/m.32996 type:complete len:434 (-) Transcript_11109:3460-4761(-)